MRCCVNNVVERETKTRENAATPGGSARSQETITYLSKRDERFGPSAVLCDKVPDGKKQEDTLP